MTAAEARQRHAGAVTKADAQRMTRYAQTDGAKTQNAKIWNAMRVLRSFTAGDLMAVCELPSPPGRGTVPGTLRYLLSTLKRAGFLTLQHKRRGSPTPGVYRLVRNSGPLCPISMKKLRIVFDPNDQKEYAL